MNTIPSPQPVVLPSDLGSPVASIIEHLADDNSVYKALHNEALQAQNKIKELTELNGNQKADIEGKATELEKQFKEINVLKAKLRDWEGSPHPAKKEKPAK